MNPNRGVRYAFTSMIRRVMPGTFFHFGLAQNSAYRIIRVFEYREAEFAIFNLVFLENID
jgi:hypothetical protein